jgi:NAD(P)-dependent dehydrogenase (short-subunit alcohol dehydrogenase family)
MVKLPGRVAVVTRGRTGEGFATAKRFVDEGAYVFITRAADMLDLTECFHANHPDAAHSMGIRCREPRI